MMKMSIRNYKAKEKGWMTKQIIPDQQIDDDDDDDDGKEEEVGEGRGKKLRKTVQNVKESCSGKKRERDRERNKIK